MNLWEGSQERKGGTGKREWKEKSGEDMAGSLLLWAPGRDCPGRLGLHPEVGACLLGACLQLCVGSVCCQQPSVVWRQQTSASTVLRVGCWLRENCPPQHEILVVFQPCNDPQLPGGEYRCLCLPLSPQPGKSPYPRWHPRRLPRK